MEVLNLPRYFFSIKEVKGKKYIFDDIRRRYVILSPEEWVRQNLIRFLTENRNFPLQLISIEKAYNQSQITRRYDLLVYNRLGKPIMIIECKAPGVEINQKAFDQATRYNERYQAGYMLISNGLKHYCCKIDKDGKHYEFMADIPFFNVLK